MSKKIEETASCRYAYDPTIDLQDVDQFGFVNLNEAIEKGIIPSGNPELEENFNGVLNPSTLMHRAQDVFEATRAAQYVKDTLALLSDAEKKQFAGSQVNVDSPSVSGAESPSE